MWPLQQLTSDLSNQTSEVGLVRLELRRLLATLIIVWLLSATTLADIRAKIEKHIKNTYLKAAQAPVGVKPVLKAWMELS